MTPQFVVTCNATRETPRTSENLADSSDAGEIAATLQPWTLYTLINETESVIQAALSGTT